MAERAVLLVAIDPGRSSGIAMAVSEGDNLIQTVDGGMSPPSMGTPYEPLVVAAEAGFRAKVIIERSTVRISRFAAHRADATKWGAYIKALFPRRNTVDYVDPRVWQRQLLGNPKDRIMTYEQYAHKFLGLELGTSDEAAALCLMEYARKCLWR